MYDIAEFQTDFIVDGKKYRHYKYPEWIHELYNDDFCGECLFLYSYKGSIEGREHAVRAYCLGYKSGLAMGAEQKLNEIKKVLRI